jgi:hypothetical protein
VHGGRCCMVAKPIEGAIQNTNIALFMADVFLSL